VPLTKVLAAERRINVAVIGQLGVNIAPYLKILGTSSSLDRIALCDETGGLFEYTERYVGPRAKDLRTFRNSAEMLRETRPDLVVISLEAHLAPPRIQMALEANCHVVVEKPACTNVADFDRLVSLATSRKRHLMLALATRIHAGAVKARQLLQSGALGKPWGTTMHWHADQTRLTKPAYHKSWFASRAKAGGGKLLFHGIHYLDLIRWLTGESIETVTGIYRNVGGQPMDVEDAAVVGMLFKSGWTGTLNTGYYLDRGFSNLIQIWCSNGWLRFDPLASLEWQVNGEKQVQKFSFPVQDLYGLMMESAVRTVLGQEPPFITARESREALAAVFQTYRAAETGQVQQVS
jgi:predicted dehydrogenase